MALLLAQACARNPRPQQPAQRNRAARSFTVTAYCLKGRTAAGTRVADGVVAADLRVLPLGTVIRVDGLSSYNGTYTVLDTGRRIRGRRIDLYMPSCTEALRFGRRSARVSIAR
jgi:3D (Asp-Asp-Asp) domain-containing protein